jgi:Nucleotidyl transferase of unknown function (DUF2204)
VPNEGDKPLPVSSSTAPDFAKEQKELFREVLQLFNDRKVPYVVSGAFALQKHTGIYRDTKDLDLFLPAKYAVEALRYLAEDGFETEVCDPVWLAKAHRSDFFVDLITGMSNAVIVVDQSWIDRGSPTEIMGVPSRVLGPEELLASKLFVTRRERFDGADTVHVIYGTKGKLDWNRILQLAGEHWEVVLWTLVLFNYCYPANTDFVPRAVWDDLLGRFESAIRNPSPKATFRGSLIDENMFAIDVSEWGLADLVNEYRARRADKIPFSAGNRIGGSKEEVKPAA